MSAKVKFVNTERTEFLSTLKNRVDQYFEEEKLSRYGDGHMGFKTFCMLTLYLAPYFLILFSPLPLWTMWVMALIMGVGKAGIGTAIMHDANHGSYSSNKRINAIVCRTLNLVGGHLTTWQIQHNVLHHTYTNVYHHDEDIESVSILRLTPEADQKPIHRFQHLYCVFLYGLLTLFWALHKDIRQLGRYDKLGLIRGKRGNYRRQMTELLLTKFLYYVMMLGGPMLFTDLSIGQWLIGFVSMHFVSGLILGLVFQAAHVLEETDFPVPNDAQSIETEWVIHQVRTSSNFAHGNPFVTWYCGGLNYQIEHHLFPKISHIHYPALSSIVERTAREFSLPYHQHPSFIAALGSHFRLLKSLGQPIPQS